MTMAELSLEEKIEYTSFFEKVVSESGDSDGELSLEGFRELMLMCGHRLPTEETVFLFSDADVNKDWKISLDEFLGVLSNTAPFGSPTSTAAAIRRKFEEHDLNKDGFISREELKTLMSDLDYVLEDDWLNLYMTEFDTNGDGKIDFEEFVNMYVKTELMGDNDEEQGEERKEEEDIAMTAEEEKKAAKMGDILISSDEIRRKCYEKKFVSFGRISVEDLKSVMAEVKMQLADEQFEACLLLFDREGYGAVNFEEFVSVFEEIPADKFLETDVDGGKESDEYIEKRYELEEDNAEVREEGRMKELDLKCDENEERCASSDVAKLSAAFEGQTKNKEPRPVCSDDGAQSECKDVGVKAMIAQLETKGE